MVHVAEATSVIQSRARDFGRECIPFEEAGGRILAEDIPADRDLPPGPRSTMDGIAIRYRDLEQGIRSFAIGGIQGAGDAPIHLGGPGACIEVMTGAAVSETADTVVRYEDVSILSGMAQVESGGIKKGQNIRAGGSDKKCGDVLATAGQVVTPAVTGIAAATGALKLWVKKGPRIMIIATGDELVDVSTTPNPYQSRRSNGYAMQAALREYALAADLAHLPDDAPVLKEKLAGFLSHYEVLVLSGGVSMGKFDLVPAVLGELGVAKLFHKVQQRPGKPFWFGTHPAGATVFAFPGNPVSAFLCLHRYFMPWLKASLGIRDRGPFYALLDADFSFKPDLQYFLQVTLSVNAAGQWLALPAAGNGSGDFAHLAATDAFMELPAEREYFKRGEAYRIWPYSSTIF